MTDEEFISQIRSEFGYHGMRDAKRFLEEPNVKNEKDERVRTAMMLAFTSNKRRAREKFTPKKYRKE